MAGDHRIRCGCMLGSVPFTARADGALTAGQKLAAREKSPG